MSHNGRRRLRPRTAWAAVASACLITVVAGWALRDRSHTYDTSVPGDVLISADGRTLTTPVIWTGCEDEPRLVAHESARTVSLELAHQRHAGLPENAVCVGSGGEGGQRLLTTTLDRPLGARTLSDAVSHDTISPFEATHLAHPRYLPKGYTPSDRPLGPGDITTPPYRRTRTPSWTVTYLRNPGQGGGTGSLSITQTTGRLTHRPGTPPGGWSLTWYAAGYTISVQAADRQLTEDEFREVADHVSP
ncbi:hypothetical protein [Streptomyces camelliae]|uniref:Lipoprotein n=1 Tax=Streptomyces camelliae TaxID=3004093 RepID=A0ABY7P5Y7_9ACTN|nr:hypothetical protein [Streptomyces sp. HUAS 2-6]WBO65975.1 hypothetical protein O1G22_25785 [Streptomyces sp. HUAS 2-6]